MKGTESFEQIIAAHLELCAVRDPKFKEKLENPKKSISDCITYILNQVQKSECNGFQDEEIFGMAMHYYDEENVEVKPILGGVQIKTNHPDPKVAKTKGSNPTIF